MMLYRLMSRLDRTKFRPQVISMMELGPVGEKIRALGIPVRSLGMQQGIPNPLAVFRLVDWLKRDKPDLIQTWMYHADLLGSVAAKLVGGIAISWNIRHSDLSGEESKRLTHVTARLCAQLSRWAPQKIVCCSESARAVHTALGYAADKMVVIPNGYDLDTFRPDPAARRRIRLELQVPESAPVIGLVGRFDPQKDHRTFLRAAGLLHQKRSNVHFILCGESVTRQNASLMKWIDEAGIQNHCHVLGRRDDIPQITASFDIASLSSSFGEAFPNVVSEAMSCEVPCVVTDVGDAALIVGESGMVVPTRNPTALADAWRNMIDLEPDMRTRLGSAARQRVMDRYNLSEIVSRYESLYEELACTGRSQDYLSSRRRYVRD
ncbi:MAG TPA: glycosyltransferase [Nitrospira sp.]|jgi:glycosyltransferase involved in cell wall biosynthesis|nr:glycosyltransferase [Nitrospira sp.]